MAALVSALVVVLLVMAEARETAALNLTVVNNCPFTIWPAMQPNAGHELPETTGFELTAMACRSVDAPSGHWEGRLWARTGCLESVGRFECATGACDGRFECVGAGGDPPATLAQLSLHAGAGDDNSYSVSLVDGFNLPVTVTPLAGRGFCPTVGCPANLLETCPSALRVRDVHGEVVACRSGCTFSGSDELCCRNGYNSPAACRPSGYSDFFKQACPATFTYAYDRPSVSSNCAAPQELKVTFC